MRIAIVAASLAAGRLAASRVPAVENSGSTRSDSIAVAIGVGGETPIASGGEESLPRENANCFEGSLCEQLERSEKMCQTYNAALKDGVEHAWALLLERRGSAFVTGLSAHDVTRGRRSLSGYDLVALDMLAVISPAEDTLRSNDWLSSLLRQQLDTVVTHHPVAPVSWRMWHDALVPLLVFYAHLASITLPADTRSMETRHMLAELSIAAGRNADAGAALLEELLPIRTNLAYDTVAMIYAFMNAADDDMRMDVAAFRAATHSDGGHGPMRPLPETVIEEAVFAGRPTIRFSDWRCYSSYANSTKHGFLTRNSTVPQFFVARLTQRDGRVSYARWRAYRDFLDEVGVLSRRVSRDSFVAMRAREAEREFDALQTDGAVDLLQWLELH